MSIRIATAASNWGSRDKYEEVGQYLPQGYKVIGETPDDKVLIAGEDYLGWTLDAYVIPRLGSALIYCEELELKNGSSSVE